MTVQVEVGLSGGTATDITTSVVQASVQRGRFDDTEPFAAGRAAFTVRNVDGLFDPDGTGFRLRDDVTISWSGNGTAVPVFTGFVEDVQLEYDLSGDAFVQVSCVDGLTILAGQSLVGTAVSEEDSGARVTTTLGNAGVSWAYGTAIDTGISTLAAGSASGNALEYLRQVEESEQGYLYVAADGTLTFRNRHTTLNNPIAGTQFSDDGSGLPYARVARFSGARALFNRVIGELTDGTERQAENAASQALYAIRTLDVGTVLLSAVAVLEDLLEYLLSRYEEPTTQIDSLTVNLDRLSAADAEKVAGFDLVDICDVEFTPPGLSQFTNEVLVQGVSHTVTVGGSWRTTLFFEPRDVRSFLVLDDATAGRLDFNVLAF